MNAGTFFNRVEILLYSSMTSIMSGISHLKPREQEIPELQPQRNTTIVTLPLEVEEQPAEHTTIVSLTTIQLTILSIILWIILGFAAGFLVGMLRPG